MLKIANKHYFKTAFNLIKSNITLILIVFFVIFAFFIFGLIKNDIFLETQNLITESILEQIAGKSLTGTIIYILSHNIFSSVLAVVLGITIAYPVFTMVVNGYFIGAVSSRSMAVTGPLVLLNLLPHGIFEVPAFVLSLAFGLKIGLCLLKKEKKRNIISSYKEALIVFVFIILPLLIVAGFIEGLLIYYSSLLV